MSFHAYLRQLNAAQQSKAASSTITKQLPPLEEQNYKVRVPCSGGHAPWPEGICTKCQPSAITLQSQVGVFSCICVSHRSVQA
jgi:nuclear protein localization family protein 4